MDNNPSVSVVVTTYNREPGGFHFKKQFLRKALASVYDQTFQDWELIIVDDHSSDNTEKYCRKLLRSDKRINYIRLDTNSGAHSHPKNVGSLAARSGLIAYLDDDNWWEKDHLQALKKALDETPNASFAYCDRIIHAQGRKPGFPKSLDWHPSLLSEINYIDTSDIMIRASALREVGGWDETLKKFADWNLLVRLSKMGLWAVHVPLRLSNYLIHEGSAQIRHKSLVGPSGEVLPTFSPHGCFIWPDKTAYGPRKDLRVCVITVTWNREDYLKRTVETMRKKAGYEFDHIIVNNGEPLKDQYDHVINIGENKGVPHAYNKALETIEVWEKKEGYRYDLIVLTDNDVEFKSDNWLGSIVDLFQRTQKLIVSPYVEGLRDNPGGSKRVGIFNAQGERVVPRDGFIDEHYLGFVMHMGNIVQAMPRKFWDGFRMKEDTFKHGTQSFQISQAALQRGYVLAYMENVKIEHMDTTSGQEKKDPAYAKLSAIMKQEKYEGAPSVQGSPA